MESMQNAELQTMFLFVAVKNLIAEILTNSADLFQLHVSLFSLNKILIAVVMGHLKSLHIKI